MSSEIPQGHEGHDLQARVEHMPGGIKQRWCYSCDRYGVIRPEGEAVTTTAKTTAEKLAEKQANYQDRQKLTEAVHPEDDYEIGTVIRWESPLQTQGSKFRSITKVSEEIWQENDGTTRSYDGFIMDSFFSNDRAIPHYVDVSESWSTIFTRESGVTRPGGRFKPRGDTIVDQTDNTRWKRERGEWVQVK